MHLEGELYNQQLKKYNETVSDWQDRLDSYQDFIEKSRAAGKAVASMEISLNNQRHDMEASIKMLATAHTLIEALQIQLQQQAYNTVKTYEPPRQIRDYPRDLAKVFEEFKEDAFDYWETRFNELESLIKNKSATNGKSKESSPK